MPTPSPSPTQAIVVNIPPEVLDRMAPHETLLSQPVATVIAATIALAAAAIALIGVRIQISSAARESQRDRRAAFARARSDRRAEAELARQSRQSELELARNIERQKIVDRAVELTHSVNAMSFFGRGGSNRRPEFVSEYQQKCMEALLLRDQMLVADMHRGATAMREFLIAADGQYNNGDPDAETVGNLRIKVLARMRRDLDTGTIDTGDATAG
ncbi:MULTISPECIES: hypothetical protein [Mycobacteroides]|uniref:hypothetical protein n=1 Tax=Mycobacteroides TaxID=670516 RepID=UPI000A9A6066|nr:MULTISPECIES: hypothetical protein [Mycobacteroides]